ncbi:complex I intermediate-associated protein 30 (CIA30) [Flavobacteriaceae bacterium MAR_2010_72]|nr:complex I intermediate-associated protein 30 (CIA30) [Flavobacteriaceae bacterium MAR_2010_72]TVZ59710.1 complex I intermediate-associated protein 30 (CIA30) [Flavobacteriaceae bacterium MAR_2010_105]
MIKLFRKIRQRLLTENKFSKYLLYAIGEIVLVVIGILIALQINNWNQNKLEQDALTGYLNSISKNIKEDIKKTEFLKTNRINEISRIPHLTSTLFISEYLERTDIKFASETLSAISNLDYFTSDLSGFESIKNSGYLRKLQGLDLENLLYKYYNLVQEIGLKEKDYNEILRNAYSNFSSQGFEKNIYISYPDYIGDTQELTNLQPYLKEILNHPTAYVMYDQTYFKGPALIVQLENLIIIGNEIVRMIDNNIKTFDDASTKNLENYFEISGTEGYSKVLTKGVENTMFFNGGYASAGNKPFEIIYGIYEYTMNVPKNDWTVVYFRNPSNAMVERPTKDFSSYKTLKLELKGDKGGETVSVALKDADAPDDGSETKVPLILSNKWETYEIPLSEFKPTNLKELYIVASFIFSDDANRINVRNIEYVK